MQVNATTLIQICNFWITYFFLQRILFKPIITMLLQKEAIKKALRDDLKYKETAIIQLQEKKSRQALDFKKQIMSLYQTHEHTLANVPQNITYQPEEKEIVTMKDTLKKFLTEKVPHAF